METVFLIAALVGGTLLICQFVLTLVGFGSHEFDGGEAMPHDLQFDGDASADTDLDGAHDLQGHDHDAHVHSEHPDSTWLFGVISFRTIVAALTFFGLVGLATLQAGVHTYAALGAAVASGVAAMYGVHFLMGLLRKLNADGTFRVEGAVGKTATVYIPIPAKGAGDGKVQMKIQHRLMELKARTADDAGIPTGAKVLVTAVAADRALEVQRID